MSFASHDATRPWRGIMVATALPLRPDLSVDYDAYAEHVRWLVDNGCDGVVPNGSQVAKTGVPIVAYNNPVDTKVNPAPTLLAQLHAEGSIVAVKEFTGDVRRAYQLAELAPALDLVIGSDDVLLELALAGAVGWIAGYPNALPDATVALYKAAVSGDLATGSTAVGRAVVATTTARGVPVQAELGGANAAPVLPDADIEQAAAHLAAAIAGYAGQKCTATSRVIAVGDAYRPLRAAIAKALADVELAPVINESALSRLTHAVDSARAAGAETVTGGQRIDAPGWFLEPTLLTGVPEEHPLLTEEFFGPLAILLPAADLDQAITRANSSPQSLATSVHTQDLDLALTAVDRLDAGMIRINAPSTGVDFHLPFGGAKAAIHGPANRAPPRCSSSPPSEPSRCRPAEHPGDHAQRASEGRSPIP
ncbi:dihydrodipicolinate synthetase family protein [Streptomyces sp. 1114.5]|uniref:aldehyde dehydrogenase family protein n=1 Tax=Streptomyces sp. 1114.5 TaxID=1938830 RepID=UPI000EABE338|nr:dihydrodipicolinate synthetase family protein [Streptomyces sp. 1114.5]